MSAAAALGHDSAASRAEASGEAAPLMRTSHGTWPDGGTINSRCTACRVPSAAGNFAAIASIARYGVNFAECWPRRLQVVLEGTELQLIGLEDFKTHKRASGRLKDLADLEALEPPQED